MRNVVADMWGSAWRGAPTSSGRTTSTSSTRRSPARSARSTRRSTTRSPTTSSPTPARRSPSRSTAGGHDAQDAATLLFLSSLSQAISPTLGLSRSEVVAYLAAPDRNITTLRGALDALQQGQAWYLHATQAGSLLFRNTENLIAKLETYARVDDTERESEIRKRLEDLFAPQTKAVYGRGLTCCRPSTRWRRIPTTSRSSSSGRGPNAVADITGFFTEQQWKNRLLFLTSDGARYSRVLERASYLRAAGAIIAELRSANTRATTRNWSRRARSRTASSRASTRPAARRSPTSTTRPTRG